MQTKVNELISRVETIIDSTKNLKDIERKHLMKGCYCLRSHDLIGLQLIIHTLSDNMEKEKPNDKYQSIIHLANSIREDFNTNTVPLTKAEESFLSLGYNRFFDLYEEISTVSFWEKMSSYRFHRVSQVFAVYAELLQHKPFDGVFKWMSKYRPPMEAEISGPLLKFIRNILAHFPFFNNWDDVWISKEIVNWRREDQSIDKFLKNYCGTKNVEYRYKMVGKDEFEYFSICLPKVYDNNKIYLKDIVSEKQGVQFSLAIMLGVLNTQIEEIRD